ncbi:MAG: winged helix DNA-binding domain-containing protein [Myxococcales bacterium]|nr:winged helix DNA-binding domain-containing protein [Myxococcales bacterium]
MKTIELQNPRELARLRRLALSAQGLLQTQPYGRGLVGARKAINHLGYVQIDTISVVERAHHHVFYARVPNYKPSMTPKMLADGNIFEYWAHAAAFLPIKNFKFSLPYKHAIKSGQTHWYKTRDEKLMGELLARIRAEGPLRSREIETVTTKGTSGWWDWKPAKVALEQLYMEGDLMISSREGFQKTYDLTERVLPANISAAMPSPDEFATHVVDQQLRCHGLVSIKGLTYHQRRNTDLRKAVKALVNERLAQGSLEQVRVGSGEIFMIEAGGLDRPLPRRSNRMLILSPFDNVVIQRQRLKAIFHYDYQIECYVPAAKRRYGYFCLPLLYNEVFVGRIDCKAHRKTRQLEIKHLHFEPHNFDELEVLSAFINAIGHFCRFQECDFAFLSETHPETLSRKALNTLRKLQHW